MKSPRGRLSPNRCTPAITLPTGPNDHTNHRKSPTDTPAASPSPREVFLYQGCEPFSHCSGRLGLSISLVGAWLEPDKLGSIILFGLALFAVLLITAWFLRLLRLRHTDDRMLAHYVEDHIPDLEQRLLTSLEFNEDDLKYGRAGVSQQFIQQLWEDAQTHVAEQQREVETVAPAQQSWITLATAVTVVSVISAVFLNSESLLNSAPVWPGLLRSPSRWPSPNFCRKLKSQ